MIQEVLELLHSGKFYNVSKSVEIAKGKKEYVNTWSETREKFNRAWRLRK